MDKFISRAIRLALLVIVTCIALYALLVVYLLIAELFGFAPWS